MFSPLFRFPYLRLITATAAALTLPLASFALNGKAMREALVADYPLTQVGLVMINNDYTRSRNQAWSSLSGLPVSTPM